MAKNIISLIGLGLLLTTSASHSQGWVSSLKNKLSATYAYMAATASTVKNTVFGNPARGGHPNPNKGLFASIAALFSKKATRQEEVIEVLRDAQKNIVKDIESNLATAYKTISLQQQDTEALQQKNVQYPKTIASLRQDLLKSQQDFDQLDKEKALQTELARRLTKEYEEALQKEKQNKADLQLSHQVVNEIEKKCALLLQANRELEAQNQVLQQTITNSKHETTLVPDQKTEPQFQKPKKTVRFSFSTKQDNQEVPPVVKKFKQGLASYIRNKLAPTNNLDSSKVDEEKEVINNISTISASLINAYDSANQSAPHLIMSHYGCRLDSSETSQSSDSFETPDLFKLAQEAAPKNMTDEQKQEWWLQAFIKNGDVLPLKITNISPDWIKIKGIKAEEYFSGKKRAINHRLHPKKSSTQYEQLLYILLPTTNQEIEKIKDYCPKVYTFLQVKNGHTGAQLPIDFDEIRKEHKKFPHKSIIASITEGKEDSNTQAPSSIGIHITAE